MSEALLSPTYDPTLFAGVAHYYTQYRPRYPEELYNLLSDRFELDGTGRLLDLGTGIGLIAIVHRRNQDETMALSSHQVSDRTAHLIQLLNLPEVKRIADLMQHSAQSGAGEYANFLTKWGYDPEQRAAIATVITLTKP